MNRRAAILLPSAAVLTAGSGLWGNLSPAAAQPATSPVVPTGPWGGPNGDAFDDEPVWQRSRVQQLLIYIDPGPVFSGIQMMHLKSDGSPQQFPLHGSDSDLINNNPIQPIALNFRRGEIIRSINGKYGEVGLVGPSYVVFAGVIVILGLAIFTNKRVWRFGFFEDGIEFGHKAPFGNEIIAFHGRSSSIWGIEAIGVKTRKVGQ